MKVRWWVCFLLFLTWLVSYIDRSLMPMAIPLIGKEFHLSPTVMGVVLSAFFVGYAAMQIPGGVLADKFGARRTLTVGILFWSLFSLLTGVATNLAMLIWVRVGFGLGEGLHPPAAFKALSVWFNSSERARANGFVMSSNCLGPMIAPILFAGMIAEFGWRRAFFLVSIPGVLVAAAVYWYLRDRVEEHPSITREEIEEIGHESSSPKRFSFAELLRYRALWHLFFIYMTWDFVWWGFQAWLPSYLLNARGFTLVRTGAITALPFAAGFVGLLIFSYFADRTGRPRTFLVAALAGSALFLVLTATASNAAWAIVFLTATGFFLPAIQGPFWALPMDMLPSSVMGYSAGFINTGGQIAGVVAPILIGSLIQRTRDYHAGFVAMALSAVLSAVLVLTLGMGAAGRMSPVASTELAH